MGMLGHNAQSAQVMKKGGSWSEQMKDNPVITHSLSPIHETQIYQTA
jgi:hypothetical protein